MVSETSAKLQGFPAFELGADHSGLNKYRDFEDANFQSVAKELHKVITRALAGALERSSHASAGALKRVTQSALNTTVLTPRTSPFGIHRSNSSLIDNPKLTIHAAVCGIEDALGAVYGLIKSDQTITFRGSAVAGINTTKINILRANLYKKTLAFVYSYDGLPKRICTANEEKVDHAGKDDSMVYNISPYNDTNPVVTPTVWESDVWSIVAIVYGGQHFTVSRIINDVQDQIRTSLRRCKDLRVVGISNDTVGQDPWMGVVKTSMIFYTATAGGPIRCAVGVEAEFSIICMLTDDSIAENRQRLLIGPELGNTSESFINMSTTAPY